MDQNTHKITHTNLLPVFFNKRAIVLVLNNGTWQDAKEQKNPAFVQYRNKRTQNRAVLWPF
jgi:hypothetical protein